MSEGYSGRQSAGDVHQFVSLSSQFDAQKRDAIYARSENLQPMPWTSSYLHKLELHVGVQLATMRECYDLSEKTLDELSQTVGDKLPAEASFVVFGSLARKEFTAGSDLDWCLMIDGKADAGHCDLEREMKRALKTSGKFKNPTPTGAFGALVFGHELIHCIGGSADTNANLTRRLLILLESAEDVAAFSTQPAPATDAWRLAAVL